MAKHFVFVTFASKWTDYKQQLLKYIYKKWQSLTNQF